MTKTAMLSLLLVTASLLFATKAEITAKDPFVKVDGIKFKLGNDQFVFQGFNSYQLPEGAGDWGPVGRLMVRDILKQAQENGSSGNNYKSITEARSTIPSIGKRMIGY